MISRYFIDAKTRSIHFGAPGDSYQVAICDNPEQAARLLSDAMWLNDRDRDAMWLNDRDRKYTAAARKIAAAQALPGFTWTT